jgi:Cdc6-like AAA superfamily ATPase
MSEIIVASIKSIKTWLSPEDCLHTNAANMSSHLSHDREELTCLWIGPYLTRFLKSNNHTLSIIGAPGSGKTVLASVITDYLQHSIGGNTYSTLYIPISMY